MELTQTHFERIAHLFPKQRGNVSLSHLTVLDVIPYGAGSASCARAPSLGARASRPQAGHRPAAWASGRRPRSRETPSTPKAPPSERGRPRQAGRSAPTSASGRRPRSRASPAPVLGSAPKADLDGIGRLGRGGAGSGVSLLSALCGPSARCGQDARAPRNHRSQGHPLGARASRPQAGRRPATWPSGRRPRSRASPVPVLGSAPKADLDGIGRLGRGSSRLGHVAPVGTLRAFGPVRARCPRSQDITHRAPWERGRPARKRATGPPHGQAGDAHALGLLQCQSSAVHPRPTSTALGASGGGVTPSGISLLSALCGPSARCGQDARAPRNIAPRATPWERGRPARKRAAGPPHGQAGDAHALGLLQCPSSAVHPRPTSTALGASGGGVAGSGVSLLSALCGPSARCGQDARAPRNIAHRATPWERGRPARKRAAGPPHGQAGDAHALGLLQCPSSAVHPRPTSTALGASGGGVAGSGVSLLSALCGPSARAHRATPWERGRPARKRATGPPHPSGRRPRSRASPVPVAVHPRPTSGIASGGGVAGSGVSLLPALCGPSARCGQDARAPRNIAHRATPWERGRPARKRAAGPPHGQAGDAHALGLLQCPSSAGHPRPTSTALGASGGGVTGSGISLLSALCGPSARCGQDARAPRTSLTGPHPGSAGVPPASGPQARRMGKRATPTLSGFSSARPRQCTQGRPRRHWAPRAGV